MKPTKMSFSAPAIRAFLVVSFLGMLSGHVYGQRNLKNIPDPDPKKELASFIVADGFEVNLYASEPMLAKPIQMNFDERGRLWIASSEVYPHIKPGQKATDKVIILEDRDHDGRADKSTVFADGLLIPTGVVPGDGGVYVVNSTDLLHISDTDGDGIGDKRRVVLSGFGTEDTHHLLHTLRWGHDGALYMNQSIYIHSHVETPYGVRRLRAGGIWRFRPDSLKLDILCRGFVNPWGHHFDHWGQSFATDGAYGEGINYVFPGSVFVTAKNATRIMRGLNPGSPKHCGLEILSGRHLPDSFTGTMVTNDFRAHRVCRFVVTENGSGYSSRQETELIKTKHGAFRPIDVKMGPDGAIYIADWYNPIIQHGEVDFRDERRDHVNGRIWRITAKGRKTLRMPNISQAKLADLLELLKAPEDWVRLQAKLRMKTFPRAEAFTAIRSWAAKQPPGSAGEHERLEALWAMQNVGRIDLELLGQLLQSKDHRVRAAAVRVVSVEVPQTEQIALLKRHVDDEHPRVRLEAVRAMSAVSDLEAVRLIGRAVKHDIDRFLDFALWAAFRDTEKLWLPQLNAGKFNFDGDADQQLFALKSVATPAVVAPLLKLIKEQSLSESQTDSALALIAQFGGRNQLRVVFQIVTDSDNVSAPQRATLLRSLVDTERTRKTRPSGDLSAVGKLLKSKEKVIQNAAIAAVGAWKLNTFRDQLQQLANNEKAEITARAEAVRSLAQLGQAQKDLTSIVESKNPNAVRIAAAIGLSQQNLNVGSNAAIQLMTQLESDPGAVDTLITALVTRKGGPGALVRALKGKEVPAESAKAALAAVQRSSQPLPQLLNAIRASGKLKDAGFKYSKALVADLLKHMRDNSDPCRGEQVYRRTKLQCVNCHAIAGAGGRVGPDLVSLGASAQPDYIIEALLAPNAKVKENFHSVIIQDEDGNVHSGIPISKTKKEVVLRTVEDKLVTIPTSSIEAQREGRSLMPEGLCNELTRQDLVDLTRFLSELGKVGNFVVSKREFARSWTVLKRTQPAQFRINRTSNDSVASGEAVFQWNNAYSKVNGELPLSMMPKFNRRNINYGYAQCQIDVASTNEFELVWNEVNGLNIWINGKPTPIQKRMKVKLPRGVAKLTVAVDLGQRQAPLKLEIIDQTGAIKFLR